MACQRLKTYLNESHVPYLTIHHSPAPTSQEVAESAHVSGKRLVKSVLVHLDEHRYAMIVLPANQHVNFVALRHRLKNSKISLASEKEIMECFPDCSLGMMPHFGNIYKMETYLSDSVTHHSVIAFNAGVDDELIEIAYTDYETLVHPTVLSGIA